MCTATRTSSKIDAADTAVGLPAHSTRRTAPLVLGLVVVLLVLGGFVVLGTGAPVGKDFLIWGFTAALVVVMDRGGCMVRVNRALQKLTGETAGAD